MKKESPRRYTSRAGLNALFARPRLAAIPTDDEHHRVLGDDPGDPVLARAAGYRDRNHRRLMPGPRGLTRRASRSPDTGNTSGMGKGIFVTIGVAIMVAACQGRPAEISTTVTTPTTAAAQATTTTAPTAITSATATLPSAESVDLIFTGGPIVTMDPDIGTAEAIAIDGDTIVFVGSASEIARYQGPDTVMIDLQGRAVQPGFIDPHTHILTDMDGIEPGQALALANGFTSLSDASVEPGVQDDFFEASLSGLLRLRTTLYLVRGDYCGNDVGTWYEEYAPDATIGDRIRIGGVKITFDGGVCGAIAASETFLEGYENGPPFYDLDTLTEMIETADAAGYQVIIHAQGDVAIAEAQDAYAAVLDGRPNVLRHRIEHNTFQTDATITRYSELGLVPLLFGSSEACRADLPWTDFYKQHGERPGDIIAANPGLIVAWHGDDPWTTPISPIYELFSLVTRGRVEDDGTVCQPADWMRGAEVARDRALEMMTINAAYAIRQDDVVGSLTPGKYADLVVLTDDLLTVSAESIPDVELLMTMIGGVTEYCAPGAEAWCPGYEPPEGVDVSASASRPGHDPELAFDGSAEGDSFWSSGADPPGWIQVDFPGPTTISEVRFVVFQSPPGDTVHELEVRVDGEWTLVETFRGATAAGDVLTWRPSIPVEDIEVFRMTTLESPSWPEWYEIEIDAGDD